MAILKRFFELFVDNLLPEEPTVKKILQTEASELSRRIAGAKQIEQKYFRPIFSYQNEMIKTAVWEIKYRGHRELAKKFGGLIYDHLLEQVAEDAVFSNFKKPLIVPIPITSKRRRERGFNQTERLAEAIIEKDQNTNFEYLKDCLVKIKETPSQARSTSRSERLRNLANSFEAKDPEKIRGRNIILLDDVITTGATMSEARKTLLGAGAKKVLCVSLAH
ncbi:MAG: phosphoribosyltransferase family protein [bacterium]